MQCSAIRANSQIPRHANPFEKKGVVREAATRRCAQNARSFSERNGWHVVPAVIGIGAAKGLPHPAILGTDSLILRWNRSAGMFDASPRLTRGGYRLHRPPFDWHRGKAARFRGAPDRRPAVFTARRLQILANLPPLGRSGTSSVSGPARFRRGGSQPGDLAADLHLHFGSRYGRCFWQTPLWLYGSERPGPPPSKRARCEQDKNLRLGCQGLYAYDETY